MSHPYRSPLERTGQTDDERIESITMLPPPEHLIRFFPIQGTPVEKLVSGTRETIRRAWTRVHGQHDEMSDLKHSLEGQRDAGSRLFPY